MVFHSFFANFALRKTVTAMLEKIEQLIAEINGLKVQSAEELEALRLKYLSKKGAINDLMADFRNVPNDQKREIGQKLNELKNLAQDKINSLKESFEAQKAVDEKPDLTRTAYPAPLGTRHPLNIVKNEIIEIFSRLGFVLADGPEVEDDWHVFSAMNFAEDHPARDMQDIPCGNGARACARGDGPRGRGEREAVL